MSINLIYTVLIFVLKFEVESWSVNKSKKCVFPMWKSMLCTLFFPITYIFDEMKFAYEIFKANQSWKNIDTSIPFDKQNNASKNIIRKFAKSKISDVDRRFFSVQIEGAVQLIFQKILFFYQYSSYPVRELAFDTVYKRGLDSQGLVTALWLGNILLQMISIFLSIFTSLSAILGRLITFRS